MATNIKITALSDITSANMTYNDLLAVVDMNGTPETKKSTVQLAGNLILAGAGGSNFVPAAVATLAGDVTNAAQPNITSVGNLTSANVTGNLDAGNINATTAVVATYFSGDGANLTNVPAGAATSITDGTSNVDIPTTDGNVTVGVGGTADVLIVTSTGVNVTGTLNATGIITGDAGGLSNIVYANVTGTPTLGNVSPLNLDGNVSNVLRGDGTFAADSDTAYGDSNVVTLLNAFGSNTITTTGLITGDGGGLSNIVYANVTGTPTLGNISTIDIDGSGSNVLYGNGVFAPASSPALTGDGYQLSNITGANVTGEVSFAATANAVAGANVSGEVTNAATANAVAYANVSGTPTLGNISTINIDGSASTVLYGNGAFAAVASSPSTQIVNGTSNVTITGTDGNIDLQVGSANVGRIYTTGDAAPAFWTIAGNIEAINDIETTGGTFKGSGSGLSAITGANVTGEVTFAATANAVAYANVSGTPTLGNISTINIDGDAANVLYGNGVFAAATSPALTGDGYQLSNITGANVTGEVSFAATANAVSLANVSGAGNIASINIDGQAANVLYGNGVFAPATSPALTGDGYQLANLTGGNVTGEVSFAATANAVDGANVSGEVTNATNATTAQTVTTAAQPNITSTGTLTSLTVTGALGVTTGVITGDGGGLSNIAGANVTGTINTAVLAQEVINSAQPNIGSVGTLSALNVNDTIVSVGLTANTGDITVTAGVFAGDGGSISNVVGANVTGEVTFAATANAVAGANVSGEVGFAAVANSVAIANVSGAGNIATVNLDGNTANYLDGTGSWGPVTATSATTAGTVTTAAQPNITSLGTLVDLDVTGNISGGNINANTNGFAIGYKEIPPVVLSANDTLALEDSGKHFRSTTAGNITLSIPTNATVAFPTGTAISIVEQAAGNILVNAISGVTLYQAGNSTAGNRVVSTYGVATLMKVDTDTWFISGTGVS